MANNCNKTCKEPDKCTEACKWNDKRLILKEVDIEGRKITIFVNKDNTAGYAYLKDGICYGDYWKFENLCT